MYLERAAASRAERCGRRRACGSRAGGGRAAARLERAVASRAERCGGAGGRRGGRSGRAESAGDGVGGAGRAWYMGGDLTAGSTGGRCLPPDDPAVGSTYRRLNRR
ncbi:hypothetical protein PVAP13_6KG060535 [Panicum virgatum]|uniref:Uncharacterized protein n=1 Tax=Panicum virgatum TaxID=38727 RepID=A0A8T0R972_PANVG|nr:hypothetical protein PVAP13_6KG060535 [Panicum virgatum]